MSRANSDDDRDERRWHERLTGRTRRAFLGSSVGASIVALAGCAGPGVESPTGGTPGTGEAMTTEGAATDEATTTEGAATEAATGTPTGEGTPTTATGEEEAEGEELPEGVSEEEFVSGPVPEAYQTATSQGGDPRDPNALESKENAQFQEAEAAVEAGLITPGPNCGNCREYIPDMNGDGFGACAAVEGYIDPDDWCALWQPLEDGASGGS